jgi:predicted metal-dependent hydrolase
VDELVEIRRSRRVRRWTLTAPWGAAAVLTVPMSMRPDEIDAVLEAQRPWLGRERARQVPQLRLTRRCVSEEDARRAARELVEMIAHEEAATLDVAFTTIAIRDQRTRWGSCSPTGALAFNWRLALAPLEVLDYVVVHELCHLRVPNHSARFWRLVAQRRPAWPAQRDWLRDHGPELLAFRPSA